MTPDEVIDFMVTIAEPKTEEKCADISFGSAGFLLQIGYKLKGSNQKPSSKMANNLTGFEVDTILADTAKIAFSFSGMDIPLILNESSLVKSKFLKEESSFFANEKYRQVMINLKKDFTFDAMFSLPRGVCANTNSSMNIVLLKKQKSDINNRVFYGGLETKKGLKTIHTTNLKFVISNC